MSAGNKSGGTEALIVACMALILLASAVAIAFAVLG